ncbi:MAG: hypothetical protein ACI8Q1_000041 [Parvicella sp.]|jgi:hypothetical protein
MENTDYLDSEEITDLGPQGPNQTLNVMCILGYIGNGLLLLLFLVALMVINSMMDLPEMEEFRRQLNVNNMEDFQVALTAGFGLFIVLIIASIVGLIGSHKGKTWGFILYAIFNGLWSLLLLISLDPFSVFLSLVSIAFIVTIGLNYKK